jgi:predicted GIY-YIG superfamily endonuclease
MTGVVLHISTNNPQIFQLSETTEYSCTKQYANYSTRQPYFMKSALKSRGGSSIGIDMLSQKKTGRPSRRWYLYVLKCSDGTLYTGITNNLSRRIEQHNAGKASRYTRSRRPVKLVFQEPCRGRSSALKKECALKSLSRKEKEDYMRNHE